MEKKRTPKGERKHARTLKKENRGKVAKTEEVGDVRTIAAVSCKFCGEIVTDPACILSRRCPACFAVESQLPAYLKSRAGRTYVEQQLQKVIGASSPKGTLGAELKETQDLVTHIKGQLKDKNERVKFLEKKLRVHKDWRKDVRTKVNALHHKVTYDKG